MLHRLRFSPNVLDRAFVDNAALDYLEDLAFISNHTGTPIAAPEDYSAAARELSSVGVWLLRGERVVARWSRKTLTVMGTNAQKVDEVKNGRHMIALENLGTIEIEGRRVPLGPMRTTLLDATMVGEPNWLDASTCTVEVEPGELDSLTRELLIPSAVSDQ